MKKILTLLAFAVLAVWNSSTASADTLCDNVCNRYSCQAKEVQEFCKSKCAPGSITNCVGKNPTPKSAKELAQGALNQVCDKAFNRVSCKAPGVGLLATQICPDNLITNCKRAAGINTDSKHASGGILCDNVCNRYSCQAKEVQEFCISKCSANSIKNCTGQNPKPKPAKELAQNALNQVCQNAFNSMSCKVKQVGQLAQKICPAAKVTNCLKAAGLDKH